MQDWETAAQASAMMSMVYLMLKNFHNSFTVGLFLP
jgi:hypothetical protein